MSAKEMFKKLGYEEEEVGQEFIRYVIEEDKVYPNYYPSWKVIQFTLDEKTFYACDTGNEMEVDMQTFKAIHQQLKELGWLDEN